MVLWVQKESNKDLCKGDDEKKIQKDEDEDENYRSIIIDLFELQLELRSRKASE